MPSMPPPTTFPPPAPSSGEEEPASRVLRFGAVVGAGALAAAIASVPAAMRIAATTPQEGALEAWVTLVACAIVPSTIGIGILRGARQGLRAFAGPESSAAVVAFSVWLVMTFGATALLGAFLRATTHHHGLAGVTFAIVSLVASLAIALVVRRGLSISFGGSTFTRGLLLMLAILSMASVIAVITLGLARASSTAAPLPTSTAALFVDLFAFAIAIGFLSRAELARRQLLALPGLPIAVGMITLGLSFLRGSPLLSAAIFEHAPAFAPVLRLIQLALDR